MMGMSGVSGAGSMPRNCGMQGMHGNSQTKQAVKAEDLAAKQQTNLTTEITKGIQGSKVDIRI